MANVLLGATGSVAPIGVRDLFDALTAAGHAVKVVATDAATYFFDVAEIGKNPSPHPPPCFGEGGQDQTPPSLVGKGVGGLGSSLFQDADEWSGEHYQRDDT